MEAFSSLVCIKYVYSQFLIDMTIKGLKCLIINLNPILVTTVVWFLPKFYKYGHITDLGNYPEMVSTYGTSI